MSQEQAQNSEQTRVNPLPSKVADDVATLNQANARIAHYCLEHSRFDPSLLKLRETTLELPHGFIATDLDALAALRMIVSLVSAKNVIEIGTFTGMSALVLAKAVAQDGKVTTIDASDAHLSLAQTHWAEAGVNEKIDARIGDGAVVLDEIFHKHGKHSFDAAYIDANKDGYDGYYEKLLKLIRPHGVIVLDNVLWKGKVADPTINDGVTMTLRNLNAKLHEDDRVDFDLLMIGDGLGVCHVKPQ